MLEFQGVPSGIDVTRVCRTGILPQINTGMAGKQAGVGQVGAGLVTPPGEIFPKALAALGRRGDPTRATAGSSRRRRPGRRAHGRQNAARMSTLPEGRSGVPSSR